ncbi:MAG: hypothetical protein GY869_26365, partial [Planctomycetes bacterium]|nr:hypothetical protein [Planctomycetota bacterium]
DLHLHYDSPCINAGDPDYTPAPGAVDIDGQPRIRLGRIDMGADEAGSHPADFDENGIIDLVDYNTIAAVMLTQTGDPLWAPACDISTPPDGLINLIDIATCLNGWLWQAPWYTP